MTRPTVPLISPQRRAARRGPDDRPIATRRLEEEVATVSSVRQPISGHPAEGLTPRRLAHIHRAAAGGDPIAYLEIAEDMEERDLHYMTVLGTRRRSVAQLPIHVDAADDSEEAVLHKDFLDAWVATGALTAHLFDVLDAIGKGYSVMEIDWHARTLMGRHAQVPKSLTWKPQRWFEFDPDDRETIRLRDGASSRGRDLAPHKFIVHRHKNKSGLTVRSGIARLCSWAWMYKAFTLKDWAIFVQNYGAPIRIGRYDRSATAEEKDVLWRAVRSVAGDMAAIMPASMDVELHEVDADRAQDLYERRCDWMDRQMSKAILGQTTTTDAVSGGHAVAKEHRLVQEDIEDYDAMLLSATLTAQLVPWIIALNFGPQDRYPSLKVGRPEEIPLEELAAAMRVFGPQGLTVEASVIRDRMGFPAPAEGAELVGGRRQPSAAGGATPPAPDRDAKPASPGGDAEPDENRDAEAEEAGAMSRHPRPHIHRADAPPSDPRDQDMAALAERLARDADPAIEAMVAEIDRALTEATSLEDAKVRLDRLALDPAAFQAAMTRGMSLAHLAGQAGLVDELTRRR